VSWFRTAAFLVAVTLLAHPPLAIAKSPPVSGGRLTFRLDSASPPIRSDAPFAVNYVLNSTFADVLAGELYFEFIEDLDVKLRLHGDPIAVPNGESAFHLVLPSMVADRSAARFAVRVAFRSAKGSFDLGTHDLVVPLKGRREFLIAVPNQGKENEASAATEAMLPARDRRDSSHVAQLAGRLRLDSFRPTQTRWRRADLVTVPVDLDVRNLPAQPIGLYSYDLLLLAEEGFSRLSARQLEAIADWIDQGGRAVIVPIGVLTPAHTAFLRRIASRESDAPSFALDRFGSLQTEPSNPKRPYFACRYGFGRALILPAMPQFNLDGWAPRDRNARPTFLDIDEQTWIRAVCFIWSVRDAQAENILSTGAWTPPSDSPVEFAGADKLRQMLFPGAVRVMPFLVVVTILASFLLAAAPGDYFLHGLLRRRWISWAAFPAICLLFTVTTVWLAGTYTGRADHRTSLVIVDLGVDGKPQRTSRIEHVLTAQTRPLANQVHGGIFALTDVQPAAPRPSTVLAYPRRPGTPAFKAYEMDRFDGLRELDYSGTLPSEFTVTRVSRQWSPSMHRITRSGSDVDVPNIDWSALDAMDLASPNGQKTLVDTLRSAVPACGICLQGASRQFVCPAADSTLQEMTSASWDVMAALARRTDTGLFSIVSHVAPDGTGNLEDLAVGDLASHDEWLVQLATRHGDERIVYRRMMRRKSNAQVEHSQ